MAATAGRLTDLPIWQGSLAQVVVEVPKGASNKLKYDPASDAFRLDRVLPVGMSFPFDFGFVPRTVAEDGDPLDAIVLLDAPLYPGCVVACRLIGNLEAEQRESKGPWERNDRLLAVADASGAHSHLRSIRDVEPAMLDAIGAFFVDYHRLAGNEFRVLRRSGCESAVRAVRRAYRARAAKATSS
jgi:inorganic pyrophosphatase